MINDLRVLAVIPARKGSKGLPGKNILPLNGKPLINWSVEVALKSSLIDAVIVSTDSEEIASIARLAGAQVPFIRPDFLSEDTSSSVEVVLHSIEIMRAGGQYFDLVVLLEPTSPLREVSDVDRSLFQLAYPEVGAVVSVCKVEASHPAFTYQMSSNGFLCPASPSQTMGLRRQDIEPLYFLEGTVYASKIEVLHQKKSFYHQGTKGYEVEKWKSLEIDDIYDFVMVEAIMNYRKGFYGLPASAQ